MAQLPNADLPVVTPVTGRATLEWYAAFKRFADGVSTDILNFNRNGFAVSIDPDDSLYGGNALQVVGTTAAAGVAAHLAFAPTGGVRLGFYIFGVYDGTSRNAAAVTSFSEAAWTIGASHPANIKFETTAVGSTTRTERARVDGTGMLLLADSAIPAGGTAGAGYRMSSTANFGIFFGSGAPTLSAAQGSLYLRSDGSSTTTRAYINTNGSTTWTNVVTSA